MSNRILSTLLAAVLMTAGLTACAADKEKAPAAGTPINKKCPVEGGDVDVAHTVVYKGKTVAFCCAGCDKDFNKDPEKYMKVLADKGDDNTVKK
jgi:YHS domain-containing protein